MPDYGIIADVSTTLAKVLTDGLQIVDPGQPPVAEVSDLQGNIITAPARVTIFLFEAVEDPSARNRPPSYTNIAPDQLQRKKAPMALLLRYMLTPWSGDRVTDHKLLGRAMQVLYNNAVLSGPQLQGQISGSLEALKVSLSPLTIEERARVWYAIQKSYRLSVTYEVRVVSLDAIDTDNVAPVSRRSADYLGPEAAQ